MGLDRQTLDRIEGLVNEGAKTVEVAGLTYSRSGLTLIKPPTASPFKVHTLQGVVDFINAGDNIPGELLVHVEDEGSVSVFSQLSETMRNREVFIDADAIVEKFSFGRYMDRESFMIELLSKFEDSPDRAAILQTVSNIVADSSVTFTDDGTSQNATVKSGVSRVEPVEIKNPVALVPYRTFPEIDQPQGKFVFRIKKERDGAVTCALFDADNGQWRLQAIKDIAGWLRGKLSKDNIKILA